MYLNKYTKYKKKYLNLKNNIFSQKGGLQIPFILYNFDENNFIDWCMALANHMLTPKDHKVNSFDMLIELLKYKPEQTQIFGISKFNVLIGAANSVEYDYLRFKDSDLYSLYIDNMHPEKGYDYDKQFHMYTIDYDDINKDNNYKQIPPEIINEIHFDLGVSAYCPINYLDIASHLLKPGGKIIWDLYYDTRILVNYFLLESRNKYLEQQGLKIKKNNDTNIMELFPINYNIFFKENTINPQMIIVFDEKFCKTKDYKNDFIDYLKTTYPSFDFELKYYTFLNYTYPVPLRIKNIEIEDILIKMTEEEKNNYLQTKKITKEYLDIIYKKIQPPPIYKFDKLVELFEKLHYYIEATKK